MPKYKFEAMDREGREIRDLIDAPSEEEAQKTIREMGYFVTKLSVASSRDIDLALGKLEKFVEPLRDQENLKKYFSGRNQENLKLDKSVEPMRNQENLGSNSMYIRKNMKNKTVQKSLATLIGLSIAFLIPLLLIYGYASVGAITYSDGTRSGVVVKVSTKGVFIKTTEGEMNYGGSLDVGGVPKVFEFSVVDPKIKDELINAEKQGRRCTLHYKQQLLQQFWKGQTSYFITKVEFLEK